MNVIQQLQSRFAHVLSDFTDDPQPFAEMVKPAQDNRFGDFQANCAMPLAKRNGVNPRELAARIVDKLDVTDLCEPPEIAGPGFINLRLKDDFVEAAINDVLQDERLGVERVEHPRTYVIDFSSPNVAKPMHVGHLRSSVIGDSLQRTLRFMGHNVISDNHIGDWGTQFGMIIYGFKNFVDEPAYKREAVAELARLYRLVNTLSDFHTAIAKIPGEKERIEKLTGELSLAEESVDPKDKSQKKALKKQRAEVASAQANLKSLQAKVDLVQNDVVLQKLAQEHPDIARLARDENSKTACRRSRESEIVG